MRTAPLAAVFGTLMVLAAAWPSGQTGFAAAAPAAAAVLAGLFYRPAATVAVLLTVAALAVLDVPAVFAAGSGVAAAGYLATRYAGGGGVVVMTVPAATGLLAFTLAGLIGTAIPLRPDWAPLLVPPVLVAVLVLSGAPLLGQRRRGPADADRPG